jgi:hypothetical protein
MGKEKKIWEMSDAELRASSAALKNKKALETENTIRKNKEIVNQIQRLRNGIGGGGAGLGGPLSGRQIR